MTSISTAATLLGACSALSCPSDSVVFLRKIALEWRAILLWVVDYLSTTSPSMGSSLSEDLEPDDLLESSDLVSSLAD